jgi:polar amino acid transport system substrate-binding protein
MALSLVEPGVLSVAAALPDPPFELDAGGEPSGFDVALMQAIAGELGLRWRLVRFRGPDFNAIFGELAAGRADVVASGATVTPARAAVADFCAPYFTSGQALASAPARTPDLRSTADLAGRVLGVQDGNTSQPVAEALRAAGRVGAVRVYPYHAIGAMLDDLEAGRIDAVMKLAPVLHWLVRDRPALRVVEEGLTEERLAVAVARGDAGLRTAIDTAQARLAATGTLGRLVTTWLTASAASGSSPATTA